VTGRVLNTTEIREDYDFRRADFEATLQRELTPTVGALLGIRYEAFRADTAGVADGRELSVRRPDAGAPSLEDRILQDTVGRHDYDSVSIRGGVSTRSGEFGVGNRFSVYGNMQAFAGWREQNRETLSTGTRASGPIGEAPVVIEETYLDRSDVNEYFVGPDISVGILGQLAPKLTLDVRYRALGYFNVYSDYEYESAFAPDLDNFFGGSGEYEDQLDAPRVTHGLNIGVSYRF
jgi:hypothetical protein